MRRCWLAVVALAIASAFVMAQTEQKQEPQKAQTFVLRYKGKAGDVNRYKSWFVLRMIGTLPTPAGVREGRIEYNSEATYLHKIISVDEEGTLEIETTKESGKARMGNGEQMKDLPDRPYKRIVKMNNRGKVLEKKVLEGEDEKDEESPEQRYSPLRWLDELFETAMHNIAFPEQAIKVGDTWRERVSEQITPNYKVTITITSRFKEIVKLDGRLCAVIESNVDAPFETQETIGEAEFNLKGRFWATVTLYFDPEKGEEMQAMDEGRLVMKIMMNIAGRSLSTTHRLISHSKTIMLDY